MCRRMEPSSLQSGRSQIRAAIIIPISCEDLSPGVPEYHWRSSEQTPPSDAAAHGQCLLTCGTLGETIFGSLRLTQEHFTPWICEGIYTLKEKGKGRRNVLTQYLPNFRLRVKICPEPEYFSPFGSSAILAEAPFSLTRMIAVGFLTELPALPLSPCSLFSTQQPE